MSCCDCQSQTSPGRWPSSCASARPRSCRSNAGPCREHAADDGFTDTPMLPGLPWHVHDPARPHPPVVTPGATPGARAVRRHRPLRRPRSVDSGRSAMHRRRRDNRRRRGRCATATSRPGKGLAGHARSFGDVQLHLEWATPAHRRGQQPGPRQQRRLPDGPLRNPGARHATTTATYADGQAGAIYGQWPPLANAAGSPASGRPTTSCSKRRGSTNGALRDAGVPDRVLERRGHPQSQRGDRVNGRTATWRNMGSRTRPSCR